MNASVNSGGEFPAADGRWRLQAAVDVMTGDDDVITRDVTGSGGDGRTLGLPGRVVDVLSQMRPYADRLTWTVAEDASTVSLAISLKILPHISKCVTALPCKMSVGVLKATNWRRCQHGVSVASLGHPVVGWRGIDVFVVVSLSLAETQRSTTHDDDSGRLWRGRSTAALEASPRQTGVTAHRVPGYFRWGDGARGTWSRSSTSLPDEPQRSESVESAPPSQPVLTLPVLRPTPRNDQTTTTAATTSTSGSGTTTTNRPINDVSVSKILCTSPMVVDRIWFAGVWVTRRDGLKRKSEI